MYSVRYGILFVFSHVDSYLVVSALFFEKPPKFGGRFLVSEIQSSGNCGSRPTDLLPLGLFIILISLTQPCFFFISLET